MAIIGNPLNSVAFLTDQFNGTGSATQFTLSVAPANTASILVAITGVVQDPSTYSVSGTTLTFSAAPPSGTGNISVRYLGIPASGVTTTAYRTITEFTATAGQTTFTPPSYTVGYIDVYRNGVRLGAADYTASNGTTVVLAVGALSGDLITTESFYVSSVLNAIPATAGAVNTTYIVDSAVTTAKIADSNVTTAKIADANVTTAKIADANVTTAKIANASVTQAKIASGVAGTGPAFSAYASGSTTLSNPGVVKVAFATEEYDTNSNYDTTNSRFTPTVAGYYQVNSTVHTNNNARLVAIVYKNGAQAYQGLDSSGSTLFSSTVSALVYCNGSTDYIEIWCFNSGTANTTQTGAPNTFFQAVLVRGA